MVSGLLDRLRNNDILMIYVPMQTLLVAEYGKDMEAHLSEWVLEHTDKYKAAAKRSFESGCDMVHTATQASSPFRSAPFGQAYVDRVPEFNYKSAKLAREITPKGCFVIGNVSYSNPDFLQPVGKMTYDEVYEGYKKQIVALAEGGVDGFHISGNHIDEGVIAVKVAKDCTDLPVIFCNVFYPTKHGFRSMTGDSPTVAAKKMQASGADVIGANCGLMTKSMDTKDWYPAATNVLRELRLGTDKFTAIQPDAGLARLVDGNTVYPATPDEMASEVMHWVDAGANLVGGCCGTSLEHYKKISTVVRKKYPKHI